MAKSALKAVDPAPADALRDPQLVKIMKLSEELVGSMKTFFGSLDRSFYGELRTIADFIAKARDEIRALRPHEMRNERLPSAGAELDAIVKDTEKATNQIMSAAEAMLACDATDLATYKAFVEEQAMGIFEACSFQDITGQRVTKVVGVLRQVEERVTRLAENLGVLGDVDGEEGDETAEQRRQREQILNGPAIGGPETNQDDIDAMFAGGGATASQDDIDSLFD